MRGGVDEGGRRRDPRLRAALGSLLFLVVAPGVVGGLVPWGLTGWKVARPPLIIAVVGYVTCSPESWSCCTRLSGSSPRASARRRRSSRLGAWSSVACTAT